jgi:modulator of FtsH protease
VEAWTNFFIGELGAAAAFAGLLFVSLSVNLTRILEIGRLADRGLEAFVMLFLTVIVATLGLVPGQPMRAFGIEILAVALCVAASMLRLQRRYLDQVEDQYRRSWRRTAALNLVAVGVFALAGAAIAATGDLLWLYLLPIGVLLSFFAVGSNAWVLLVEINR